MLLMAVDIGNTNVVIGFIDDGKNSKYIFPADPEGQKTSAAFDQ